MAAFHNPVRDRDEERHTPTEWDCDACILVE